MDAIANLATSTSSGCAYIVAITATNNNLTAKVAAAHAKLVVAFQGNAKLANTIANLHRKGGIISPSSSHDTIRHYC